MEPYSDVIANQPVVIDNVSNMKYACMLKCSDCWNDDEKCVDATEFDGSHFAKWNIQEWLIFIKTIWLT